MNSILAPLYTVALVGIDGSGKSTQAALLRDYLQTCGYLTLGIHPFGCTLLGLRVSREGRAPEPGRTRMRVHPLALLAAWWEIFATILYLWTAHARTLGQRLASSEVWLVSDRSFDDVLLKHRRTGVLSARGARVLRRLVPRVMTTIWLRTTPETARARDGDFPPAYYHELHSLYTAAAAEYGWITVPTDDRLAVSIAADITQWVNRAARSGLAVRS